MFEIKSSMPSNSIILSRDTSFTQYPNSEYLASGTVANHYGTSISTEIFNPQPITMKARQVKVAIFSVTRDIINSNNILHSKFMKEIWVEVPADISLELVVAKELGKELDPLTMVVKEIYSVSF